MRIVLLPLFALAFLAGAPSAWAAYGCRADSGKTWGLSYGKPTIAVARAWAIKSCQAPAEATCHITRCESGIDDQEIAKTRLGYGGRATDCFGTCRLPH